MKRRRSDTERVSVLIDRDKTSAGSTNSICSALNNNIYAQQKRSVDMKSDEKERGASRKAVLSKLIKVSDSRLKGNILKIVANNYKLCETIST